MLTRILVIGTACIFIAATPAWSAPKAIGGDSGGIKGAAIGGDSGGIKGKSAVTPARKARARYRSAGAARFQPCCSKKLK